MDFWKKYWIKCEGKVGKTCHVFGKKCEGKLLQAFGKKCEGKLLQAFGKKCEGKLLQESENLQ